MSYRKIEKASEFVHWVEEVEKHKTLYVMGCFGAPMDDRGKKRYSNNHPYNRQSERRAMISAASPDTFGFDCVCLIKGVLWGWTGDTKDSYGGGEYGINGVPDIDADQMMNRCHDISTDFSHILPGEALGMDGHIGVYIGNGMAIECTPKWRNCVQRTAVLNIGPVNGYPGRTWTRHGKLPYFEYDTSDTPAPAPAPVKPEHDNWYHSLQDVPNYAKKTIKMLIDTGRLYGREGGDLDLSDDMVRILCIVYGREAK